MGKRIRTHDAGFYHYDNVYPWHDWLDGSTWLLTPGEDFKQPVPAFRTLAYRIAKENEYRLRTRLRPEGLYIQALDSEGNLLPPLPPGT